MATRKSTAATRPRKATAKATAKAPGAVGAVPTGVRRPSALVDLDISDTLGASEAHTRSYEGSWTRKLRELRKATEDGQIPSDENGVRFIRLARYGNPTGARGALKDLTPDKLPGRFEFVSRLVTDGEGKRVSEIWGRYEGDGDVA